MKEDQKEKEERCKSMTGYDEKDLVVWNHGMNYLFIVFIYPLPHLTDTSTLAHSLNYLDGGCLAQGGLHLTRAEISKRTAHFIRRILG